MIFDFLKKIFWKADERCEENIRKRKAESSMFDEGSKKYCFEKSSRVKILKEVKKKSIMDQNLENYLPTQVNPFSNFLLKNHVVRPESFGFAKSVLSPHNESLIRHSTIHHTHRLEEKRQYNELLKQFSSSDHYGKARLMHLSRFNTGRPANDSSFLSRLNEIGSNDVIDVENHKFSFTFPSKQVQKPKSPPMINSLQKYIEKKDVMNKNHMDKIFAKYDLKLDDSKKEARIIQDSVFIIQHNNRIEREVNLTERLNKTMTYCPEILDEKDLYKDIDLPPLTPDILKTVDSVVRSGYDEDIVANNFGLMVKRRDIKTLTNLNWLNDEVINFYMNLLIERSKQPNNLKVYAMNTFFYPKLLSGGHASLKRWTRKIDVFAQDLLLIPIHLGIHWCMATVDFRNKAINYYDSMGSENQKCLVTLRQYLLDEHLDKKKSNFDLSDWVFECHKNIPQQMNGSDCGVFSCMFAEYSAADRSFSFTQNDMPYFRKKMIYEIISMKLL